MYQKQCRLTLADKFFGGALPGGGGGTVDPESLKQPPLSEKKEDIKSLNRLSFNQLSQYVRDQPVQLAAQIGVQDIWKGLLPNILPIIQSGGNLQGYDPNAVRAESAQRGMATGNQSLVAQFLDREKYKTERFNTALGQATTGLNQLLGVQGGSVGQFSTLTAPNYPFLTSGYTGDQQAATQAAGINAQIAMNQPTWFDFLKMAATTSSNLVGGILSDERLKTKIRDTGIRTEKGIPWKFWEYATRPGVKFIGHTAQDVEKHDPDAVHTDPLSGIKSVGFKYFPIQLTKGTA